MKQQKYVDGPKTRKNFERTMKALFLDGWTGLCGLEFVGMGPGRGYHFGNSRGSREMRRVPLDKDEGVVKAQNSVAVVFTPCRNRN